MLSLNKCTKTKPERKPTLTSENGPHVCVPLHTTVRTEQFDNFPSYPPDSRHCSDDVYWGEEELFWGKMACSA